jgi:hypothetical protein
MFFSSSSQMPGLFEGALPDSARSPNQGDQMSL